MPALNSEITGVAGDDIRIDKTFTGLTTGKTVNKAYLTIKRRVTDPDPGIVQKTITGTLTASGHITDGTTPDVTLFFNILDTESSLIAPSIPHVYDIQLHTTDGDIWTREKGALTLQRGVTLAVS